METQQSQEEKPDVSILILGLDDAGKTTLLYKLKMGDNSDLNIVSTIGFNVETLEFHKNFTFWDVGGRDTMRVLWKFYTHQKSAVCFVVDASNSTRFTEAKDFLHLVMADEDLNNVKLFVIANKQDKVLESLSDEELEEKLNLKNIKQKLHIVKTSAFDRESLNNLVVQLGDVE